VRKRWRVGLSAAVVGCVLLAGCSSTTGVGHVAATTPGGGSIDAIGVTTYAPGQRPSIPDLSGPTLDGSTLSLSSLKGHVVVLNAWASWCDPCRNESPALGRLAKQTAGLGVRFVGIDEQDTPDSARKFAASAGTTYPHLIDEDGSMLGSLRLVPPAAIPSTLVLDRSGLVAGRIIGPIDATSLAALIRAVASEAVNAAGG
jgi:thiol-disulfide isomerase/thioredoxin